MHTSISGTLNAAKYLDTLWRGSEGAGGAGGVMAWSAMTVRSAHFQAVWKEFRAGRCENLRNGDVCVAFCASQTPARRWWLRLRCGPWPIGAGFRHHVLDLFHQRRHV